MDAADVERVEEVVARATASLRPAGELGWIAGHPKARVGRHTALTGPVITFLFQYTTRCAASEGIMCP